jgi:hypothetical protein
MGPKKGNRFRVRAPILCQLCTRWQTSANSSWYIPCRIAGTATQHTSHAPAGEDAALKAVTLHSFERKQIACTSAVCTDLIGHIKRMALSVLCDGQMADGAVLCSATEMKEVELTWLVSHARGTQPQRAAPNTSSNCAGRSARTDRQATPLRAAADLHRTSTRSMENRDIKEHYYPERGGCKFGIIPGRSRPHWPAGGAGLGLGGGSGARRVLRAMHNGEPAPPPI